jgi:hypothetical protein
MMQKPLFLTVVLGWIVLSGPYVAQAESLGSFDLNIISTVGVDLNIKFENEIALALGPDGALENLSVVIRNISVVSVEALTTVTFTLAGLTPGNTDISISSPPGGPVDASGNVSSSPSGGVTVTPEPGTCVLLGTFLAFGWLFTWRFRKRDA